MKPRYIIAFIVFVVNIFCFPGVSAQRITSNGSKFASDKDSSICMSNWAVYKGFFKYGNYKEALTSWRYMFYKCPALYESVYIDGIRMFNSFAGTEKNFTLQTKLLDTLEMIYRQRIVYFGKKGEMLSRFGIDYLSYRHSKPADLEKGYRLLEQALYFEKNDILWLTAGTYFKTTVLLYNSQKLSIEKVIENYTLVAGILDSCLLGKPNDKDVLKAKELLDNQFTSIKTVDCIKLCSVLTPIFEKDQDKLATVKSINQLLRINNCIGTKLYERVIIKLYQLDPSSKSAYILATLLLKKGNNDKAIEYLKQAIEKESDAIDKAKYLTILGTIFLSDNANIEMARTYALEALKLRKDWGVPYILIGKSYIAASESCGSNNFEKKAVIWAAVDKFELAKKVDASCTEEVNILIDTYSKHFPDKESAFFYGINPGDSYKINCWINETTFARF